MPSPDLPVLQRGLRDLIKRRWQPAPDSDPYFREVAASQRLALVQEIAEWWRRRTLAEATPLTVAALAQRGLLTAEVSAFTAAPGLDPDRRAAARAFLAREADSPDRLVAAVAGFERALLAVRLDGSSERYRIDWPCDPLPVLDALLHGTDLPIRPPSGVVEVAAGLPGGWRAVTASSG